MVPNEYQYYNPSNIDLNILLINMLDQDKAATLTLTDTHLINTK